MYEELILKSSREVEPIPTNIEERGILDSNIEAVLFDVYGTLFISASGDISIAQAESEKVYSLESLLLRYGIKDSPTSVKQRLFDEITREHNRLKKEGIEYPEVHIDKIWKSVIALKDIEEARRFSVEYELLVNPVYPMPNLLKTLSAIKERDIPMGMISNAQFFTQELFPAFLNESLEALGFKKDLLFYSYEYRQSKPGFALYENAAKALLERKISVSNTLYIGNDMLNDIYPAHNVGFKTVLFAGDKRALRLREDDARCKNIIPSLIINDLYQIVKHIEK